jgi:hypothetical protein
MKNKVYIVLTFLTVIAILSYGCSSTISYSPSSYYSENDFRDINDEDILKAFQAKPQIKLPARIAWYDMSRDNFVNYLKFEDENIIESYEIPKTLIEGSQPLFNNLQSRNFYFPQPIDFKAVRLMAARAKCDLVILASSRFEEKRDLNSWATLNVLIIPTLFTSYLDVEYRYSSEIFIFDVRNGYMYKHLKYDDAIRKPSLNIWETKDVAEKINNQMIEISTEYMRNELKKLFNDK